MRQLYPPLLTCALPVKKLLSSEAGYKLHELVIDFLYLLNEVFGVKYSRI
jgi:hypothetical protein